MMPQHFQLGLFTKCNGSVNFVREVGSPLLHLSAYFFLFIFCSDRQRSPLRSNNYIELSMIISVIASTTLEISTNPTIASAQSIFFFF
ncbi:hypothetical protein EUGRSUZ_D00860 [Eucalyptus grandis]|uniref:Uncharacterized protein n=2 Tax=Eucalyptus grandis TaxID=71139 RepID=A0ACC3L3F8_EUCGR|nr:hypothetical protein EUGRSUZ_D00860 [Eucalyptus grandis]